MAQEHDDQVDAAPPNVVRFVIPGLRGEAVEGTPEPLEPQPFLAPEVAEEFRTRYNMTRHELVEALRIPGEGFRPAFHLTEEARRMIREGGWEREQALWREEVPHTAGCLQIALTPEDAAELVNALHVALDLDMMERPEVAERLHGQLLRLLNPETV